MKIATTLKIRDLGFDEYWLQDRIFENPNILGLGELESVSKERKQSSGGRLDLLLKNPEDNSMYEVEVMLGHTDESHIIRALEYWDIERRRWPRRQHSCVLVAEVINRRFFNVIQLLSNSIPIIAIQVSIIDTGNEKVLHFTKILDAYEEPELEESVSGDEYNEAFWRKTSTSTVDLGYTLLEICKSIHNDATIGFVKNYISLSFGGKQRIWLRSTGKEETRFTTWLDDKDFENIEDELGRKIVKYRVRNGDVMFNITNELVKKEEKFFRDILAMQKDY